MTLSDRQLIALMAAVIRTGGKRCNTEAVDDAREMMQHMDEQEEIRFHQDMGITHDPDGFDTLDEIREALGRRDDIRAALGKTFGGEF